MMREINNMIDNMTWLLDDDPRIKKYLEVNGKEIVNDFKKENKPKPKKPKEEKVFRFEKRFNDDWCKMYNQVCKIINTDPTTIFTPSQSYTIKRVIINPPAVIILWGDDTKTIAKCEDMDVFDAEKGFAIALAKKFVGNERFRNMLEKYVWEVE